MQGWEILNAVDSPIVDHARKADDLSVFDDGTFSTICASHVVEHLDYRDELPDTLTGWNRVLQYGGKL